jgi:hypothetical protein
VECICADGTTIPPCFIFKGEAVNTNLAKDKKKHQIPGNWRVTNSPKGWTSNIHGLYWLKACFKPETAAKAAGGPRVLICDGHDSHISANSVRFCIDHNIILLVTPPHASHLLQPLDLAIFGPLKKHLSREVNCFTRTGVPGITKPEWLLSYHWARPLAMRKSNIASGWRRTGLIPFQHSSVMRRVPTPPTTPSKSATSSITTTMQGLDLSDVSPSGPRMHGTNALVKRMLASRQPLPTPAKMYLGKVLDHSERLSTELTLARKESNDQKVVLEGWQ